ncbi:MAG: endonuclease/exonuclease/phosphatase family protein [Planctomycetes bacterium]|nr:endonuclease/exonuclease/phosphatase family protein [Planctomycetota bacterium]
MIGRTLLCLLALAASMPGCAARPVRLRVLTYNIHHGRGADDRIDLDRIAGVIRAAAPDLVALQEVDDRTTRSEGVDQRAELGRLTSLEAVFGKAMDYAGGGYGEAVLSRIPIESSAAHALPFTGRHEPRCALEVRVRPGDGDEAILFIGTHLDHTGDPADRIRQARAIAEIVAGEPDVPVILAGDFNDIPGSETLAVFDGAWLDTTAGDPAPTFPADAPRKKIDYVLASPAARWRVVSAEVIEERSASDHRPLLVVLERVEP